MVNYPSYEQTPIASDNPSAAVAINPYAVTNTKGTFGSDTFGAMQGVALDSTAIRFSLSSGRVAGTETKPMYGGLPIVTGIALMPNGEPTNISRATDTISGFSVANQSPNMIVTANSNCPSIGGGGTINFYRLGTNARIPLPIDPAFADMAGQPEGQYVTWDSATSMLKAASAPVASVAGSQSDDSSSSSSKKSASVATKEAVNNKGLLKVNILAILRNGRLIVEDGKGNINWVNVSDDPNGRLLAIVQI